jgi:quinol monooxygenase YgiN
MLLPKVKLSGYILVPENDLAEVQDELARHVELSLSEDGCLVFELTPDAMDQCRFNIYEEFVDEASFEQHQARVQESKWGKITGNVERHYQIVMSE